VKIQNSINVVATLGKPTLFFMINEYLRQMILLDEKTPKRLNYTAFDSFKIATRELIKYEP